MKNLRFNPNFVSIIPDSSASKALLLFKGTQNKSVLIMLKDAFGNLIKTDNKEVLSGEKLMEYELGSVKPGKYLLSIVSEGNRSVSRPVYKS